MIRLREKKYYKVMTTTIAFAKRASFLFLLDWFGNVVLIVPIRIKTYPKVDLMCVMDYRL